MVRMCKIGLCRYILYSHRYFQHIEIYVAVGPVCRTEGPIIVHPINVRLKTKKKSVLGTICLNVSLPICDVSFVLAVKPVKGDALLFFSLHPNATTDTKSLHGSCPVIEGEKWSATKWIHVRSWSSGFPKARTGGCRDEDDMCPRWAAAGECAKNPEYMVGTRASPGSCRKSCNVCRL